MPRTGMTLAVMVLAMIARPVWGQTAPATTDDVGGGKRPDYALLRADENWSSLSRPSAQSDLWDRLKFIPLTAGGDCFLSLGGEIRDQYERTENETWGTAPWDRGGYLLQHYMFHADIRVRANLRFFAQLKSGLETGRQLGPRPTDEDRLDLQQAFLDFGVGSVRRGVTLRLGRQEMNFGSSRLVSVRDGPNVRQTFDAVRAVVTLPGWRIDNFVSRPVTTSPGVFDDRADSGRAFWGTYAVHHMTATSGLDLYYLGLSRVNARFDQGVGNEVRQTMGARLWSNGKPLDYNIEAIWQGGHFGSDNIRAWSVASETGWHPALPGRPRLCLRADITSGDKNRKDQTLGTFNPLFPKGAYFGRIDPLGPYNHMDLHPGIDADLPGGWHLSASWLWFWRTRIDDGVYAIAGQLLFSGEGTHARYVGQAPELELERQLTRHFSIIGNVARFSAGPFFREVHATRNIDYVTAITTYKF